MNGDILVIRFGSLGDVILTSATILNLKLNYPEKRIIYLTKERFRSVVTLFDGVDEIVTISEHASISDLWALRSRLRKYRFDTILDLHGNYRSWLTRYIVSGRIRVVYTKRRWERHLAVWMKKFPSEYPHTIDLYNDTLRRLGRRPYCHRPLVDTNRVASPPCDASHRADRTVVFAPGAAHANKQWPVARFAQVAKRLSSSHGVRVVWAVTSEDAKTDDPASLLPLEKLKRLIDSSPDVLASELARADLAIANDSGVAHLASAVGTPVLAVFGPTHPVLGFSPRGLNDRVIEVDEYCRPCSLHGRKPCFREERFCFTRISPDYVARLAGEMLDTQINRAPALIVDRDGTVMVDKHFLSDARQVELVDGSAEALRRAGAAGYKIVIVSNQSGVARGYFGIEEVERVNARLLQVLAGEGVKVDAIYYCPHHPQEGVQPEFSIECNCRKPGGGMAERAAAELGIDLRRSMVVGDSLSDLYLGRVIGCRSMLVRTGYGAKEELKLKASGEDTAWLVFDDLLGAIEYSVGADMRNG